MDVIRNVTGSNIYIPDSNGDPIVNLELQGDTYQNGTPTPDNPVPVNVVSGRQDIWVCGKNLFDNAKIEIGKAWHGERNNQRARYYIKYIPNENYTITLKSIPSEINAISVVESSSSYDNTGLKFVENITGETTYTHQFNADAIYLVLQFTVSSGTFTQELADSIQIQIEKGNQASSFEEYRGNDYLIDLGIGENIFDAENTQAYKRNSSTIITIENNDITIGNRTSGTAGFVWWNIPVDSSKEIRISYSKMEEVVQNIGDAVQYDFSNTPITSYSASTIANTTQINKEDKSVRATPTGSYLVLILRTSGYSSSTGTGEYTISDLKVEYTDTSIELCKINDYQDFIRKGTGKNINSSVLEVGSISNGENIKKYSTVRTQDYIEVKPNTNYAFSINGTLNRVVVSLYDINKNYIPTEVPDGLVSTTGLFTTFANAYYIRYRAYNADKNLFQTGNIQLEEGNQATSFEPYGYKDKWYLYKTIGKVILTGENTENWSKVSTTGNVYRTSIVNDYLKRAIIMMTSNYFQGVQNDTVRGNYCCNTTTSSSMNYFYFRYDDITTTDNFKTWLSTHNTTVYYVLATPTTTEITDSELISQLESIELLEGINNINVISGDLPAILSIYYYTWYRYISPEDRQALIDNIATIPFRINVIQNNQIIKTLDEHSIISANYEDFRYVDTSTLVVGQFVARKFTGKLDNIYTDFEIEDTELNVQMGVSYNNNTNYYDLGNFLVTKPKKDNVKDKTSFESMDYTKKFNKVFDNTTLTYPCTALDLAIECCRQADVELATLDFTNYDFQIPNNQYTENETCRKVMQDIGKLAYSWVRIDWDNRCYLDFNVKNNIVDSDKLTNSNYYSLNLQKKVFGPVNRVVIGMQDVEGENAVIEDAESIAQYGVTELQIYDNNITYTPELRLQAIQAATKLFGIAYTPVEMNTTGHPWLLGNEKVQITTMEDETIYTYPWDRSIAYNGHIKTKITSKADTKTETEYKNYGGLEDSLRKTRIIVDKEQGQITSLTSQTQTMQDDLRQNYYTSTKTSELVQTAQTSLTNTFSEAGGNNIFRNTGLWFATSDSNNPYEFWNGIVLKQKEEKASNMSAMLLQNGNVSQEQLVPNGKYTISFKYNKPVLLATAKIYINDTEYVLNETTDTEFTEVIEVSSQHINIRFNCDVNNGCEIYDLMVNAGEVKLAYSQNQNETTTDTVNISKGIAITSSDTNTLFKADSDGIRIYDENSSNADPTTKFIDTGMETDEALVKNKANIVETLWQKVGSQTWITRL